MGAAWCKTVLLFPSVVRAQRLCSEPLLKEDNGRIFNASPDIVIDADGSLKRSPIPAASVRVATSAHQQAVEMHLSGTRINAPVDSSCLGLQPLSFLSPLL
jgi:hypothetical protein